MKKILTVVLLLTIVCGISYSQINLRTGNLLSTHKLIFSEGVGPSISRTDYSNIGIGYNLKVAGEYYFYRWKENYFGGKISANMTEVSGTDNQKAIDAFYTEVLSLNFGLSYSIRFDDSFYPYASAGLAITYFDPRDNNKNKLPGNTRNSYEKLISVYFLEAGLKYRISDNFLVYGEGTLYTHTDDWLDDYNNHSMADFYGTVNFGISYAITWEKDSDGDGVVDNWDKCDFTPPNVQIDEYGCPLDTDNDSVPDFADNCPDTPLGIAVDRFGCPFDTDGDRVPDYMDSCKYTPKNVSVDDKGCPVDTDKDGIPDYKDLCPDSEPGVEVDSSGCYIMQKDQFLESVLIYFDSGTDNIKPEYGKDLEKLVYFMKSDDSVTWYIEGHMDGVEKSEQGEDISALRAKKVFEYLILKGVPLKKIKVSDKGSKFAVADNSTIDGREKNRRVVIFGVK